MAISRITTESILDGEITDGKIAGVAASKLTGALPAISGASLTNLPSEITKSASDPSVSTNPSGGVGTLFLNTTSGEMFSLTDATAGSNIWTNIGDGTGTVPTTYMSGTGGTITTDGSYKVHTFLSSGTFTSTTGNVASVGTIVDYLVIAGGGGAGGSSNAGYYGSGGGAGGYLTDTGFSISSQAYTITVGGGAAGGAAQGGHGDQGTRGGDSVFSTITSTGGGGGGAAQLATAADSKGLDGGSGGGGGAATGGTAVAGLGNTPSTTPSQGNNGGTGNAANSGYPGAGGGAGGTGTSSSGNPGSGGAAGGAGLSSSITGSAVTRASGGKASASSPVAGVVNTGEGGDGKGFVATSTAGQAGGSGVVIIRYQFQA